MTARGVLPPAGVPMRPCPSAIDLAFLLLGALPALQCSAGERDGGPSGRALAPAMPPGAPATGTAPPGAGPPSRGEVPLFGDLAGPAMTAPNTPVAASRCTLEGRPKTTVRGTVYD